MSGRKPHLLLRTRNNLAPRRRYIMRRPRVSICRTASPDCPGSRGCRFRRRWSNAWRYSTGSVAAATSRATPIIMVTMTAKNANSAVSAWSKPGTPKPIAPTPPSPIGKIGTRRHGRRRFTPRPGSTPAYSWRQASSRSSSRTSTGSSRLCARSRARTTGAAMELPDLTIPAGLSGFEAREACRALKGHVLRVETYSDDDTSLALLPFDVVEHNYEVRRIQPVGVNRYAVFAPHERETLSFHYDRVADDPRVEHHVVLEVDPYDHPLREISIAYPRRAGYPDPEPALLANFRQMLAYDQTRLHVMGKGARTDAACHHRRCAAPADAGRNGDSRNHGPDAGECASRNHQSVQIRRARYGLDDRMECGSRHPLRADRRRRRGRHGSAPRRAGAPHHRTATHGIS